MTLRYTPATVLKIADMQSWFIIWCERCRFSCSPDLYFCWPVWDPQLHRGGAAWFHDCLLKMSWFTPLTKLSPTRCGRVINYELMWIQPTRPEDYFQFAHSLPSSLACAAIQSSFSRDREGSIKLLPETLTLLDMQNFKNLVSMFDTFPKSNLAFDCSQSGITSSRST